MAKLELDKHSIAFFHRNHRLYTKIQLCALLYVHVPLILFFKMWHKTDQYSYALIMRTENFDNFTQVVHMIFSNVYTLS